MKSAHNHLRRIAAVLIGIVFFASGTLKLMDPVGTGLIVSEYFRFFHVSFLLPAAKVTGIIVAFTEAVTGAALISGAYRKLFAIIAFALTCVFTVITLILWIANPSFSCGCFGEAIPLTHAQSLVKNIILLVLAAIAFIPFKEYGGSRVHRLTSFWIVTASSVAMLVYSLVNIPLQDFTPFDHSSRLLAAELAEPDEHPGEEVTLFVFEKNGEEGSFFEGQFPDSSWTFVRTEPYIKQDNILASGHPELSFTDADGVFVDSLATREFVWVASVYAPDRLKPAAWERIAASLAAASDAGYEALLLLAAEPGTAAEYIPEALNDVPAMAGAVGDAQPSPALGGLSAADALLAHAYYSDYRTLVSLNRSNGGITYFNDGYLIAKWPVRQFPDADWLAANVYADSTEVTLTADTRGRIAFQAYFVYAFALLFLL